MCLDFRCDRKHDCTCAQGEHWIRRMTDYGMFRRAYARSCALKFDMPPSLQEAAGPAGEQGRPQ